MALLSFQRSLFFPLLFVPPLTPPASSSHFFPGTHSCLASRNRCHGCDGHTSDGCSRSCASHTSLTQQGRKAMRSLEHPVAGAHVSTVTKSSKIDAHQDHAAALVPQPLVCNTRDCIIIPMCISQPPPPFSPLALSKRSIF